MVTRRIPLTFAVRKGHKTGYTTHTHVRENPEFRKQVLDRIFAELRKWRDRHSDTLHFLECAEGVDVVEAIDQAWQKRTLPEAKVKAGAKSRSSKPLVEYEVVYAEAGDAAERPRSTRSVKKKRSR
jgi:hypothetical protein